MTPIKVPITLLTKSQVSLLGFWGWGLGLAGSKVMAFRALGFRALGFRAYKGLGFRALGFRACGF